MQPSVVHQAPTDQLISRQTQSGPSNIVVCAALDGESTAMQRETAEFRSSFAFLERMGVPVMIWSGHTRAELEMMRQAVGVHAPFVSEGGAALFVPDGYFPFPVAATRRTAGYEVIEFGKRYDAIAGTLRRIATSLPIEIVMLSDMTIEEAAREFGVGLPEARLVKLREYGELFRVVDRHYASRGRLFRALHAAGLTCSHGSRYDAVTAVSDRTAALQAAYRLLQRARGPLVRIGIGSRAEDLPVLAQADVRLVIRDEDPTVTEHLVERLEAAHVIEQPGTEGWVQALTRITAYASGRSQ